MRRTLPDPFSNGEKGKSRLLERARYMRPNSAWLVASHTLLYCRYGSQTTTLTVPNHPAKSTSHLSSCKWRSCIFQSLLCQGVGASQVLTSPCDFTLRGYILTSLDDHNRLTKAYLTHQIPPHLVIPFLDEANDLTILPCQRSYLYTFCQIDSFFITKSNQLPNWQENYSLIHNFHITLSGVWQEVIQSIKVLIQRKKRNEARMKTNQRGERRGGRGGLRARREDTMECVAHDLTFSESVTNCSHRAQNAWPSLLSGSWPSLLFLPTCP